MQESLKVTQQNLDINNCNEGHNNLDITFVTEKKRRENNENVEPKRELSSELLFFRRV